MDEYAGTPCLTCDKGEYYVLLAPAEYDTHPPSFQRSQRWGLGGDRKHGLLRCKACGTIEWFINPKAGDLAEASAATGITWSG